MKISIATKCPIEKDTLCFLSYEKDVLGEVGAKLDKDGDGFLSDAIKDNDFKAERGKFLEVNTTPLGVEAKRVILIGCGKAADYRIADGQKIGGRIARYLAKVKFKTALLQFDDIAKSKAKDNDLGDYAAFCSHVLMGFSLANYRFDKYHTDKKRYPDAPEGKLEAYMVDVKTLKAEWKIRKAVIDGVNFARDLVSEPPNILYPESFAKECLLLEKLGVKVTVLGEKAMEKEGMGALLSVGKGSVAESQLVIMEWDGRDAKAKKDEDARPLAFVGKGVTFDTGGISIKPSGGMEDMKFDMGGAAAVSGLIKALAGRKAKAHVIGVIGLAENMPSGNATRPSDVVTSMSGQTIEVINTDAEGRMVLADSLTYVQKHYDPEFVVNLATLTGAILVSLGMEHAGLFSNDDDLSSDLLEAGENVNEFLWRMPIGKSFDRQINSVIADIRNTGTTRWGGSCTAAQFLHRFIDKDRAWAHLDIAGTAWTKTGLAVCPKGATGYGVQLLDALVGAKYE